jgi:DNA-directed RNA polymerase specialized sigma54-like protein
MRLGYGMKLEQTQKLVMTPELRQAIKVLQLSAIDLAQYVENAMLENPHPKKHPLRNAFLQQSFARTDGSRKSRNLISLSIKPSSLSKL